MTAADWLQQRVAVALPHSPAPRLGTVREAAPLAAGPGRGCRGLALGVEYDDEPGVTHVVFPGLPEVKIEPVREAPADAAPPP